LDEKSRDNHMTVPGPPANRFGVNVLDYGADPTGIGDSVVAFENAMMAQVQAGHSYGLIQVPLGRFRLSRSVNLSIIGAGKDWAIRVVGEATNHITRGGPVGNASTIVCSSDYAFKITDYSTPLNPNEMCFEHLSFEGYGGIFGWVCQPTVRDCYFAVWRGCTFAQAWRAVFENVYMQGMDGTYPYDGGRLTGHCGIHVHAAEVLLMHGVSGWGFHAGTAIAISGNAAVLEGIHIETSRVGLMLGYCPDTGAGFDSLGVVSGFQVTCEGCLIGTYFNSVNGTTDWHGFGMQTHEDPMNDAQPPADAAGNSWSLCGIYINNCRDSLLENFQSSRWSTQACVITSSSRFPSGLNTPPDSNVVPAFRYGYAFNQTPDVSIVQNNYRTTPGVTYPIGTTTFTLFKGFSTQRPQWLVAGVKVADANGKIPAGTTITSVAAWPNITISGTGNTAAWSTSVTNLAGLGDSFIFYDASNNILGSVDWGYFLTPSLAPI
jgi:hypothetical protein